MKIERTKNATRNIAFGVALKIYQLFVPFLMRTIIVHALGAEYAGLNSLFTSILQVLNLAELGVGSAMTFSMYKPIAEDDKEKICALMKLYRSYYRYIGVVVALLGGALLPFIPKLVKADIPDGINIYLLYIMNLSATVLSYWLFAYKNSILIAHQRMDISSKVSIVLDTIKYIVQVLVLLIFRDYYLYILAILITQVLNNIVLAVISDRLYPQYSPRGELDRAEIDSINSKIKDLFTSKIGVVIINSADSIVVSAFLGLKYLTIYQNYYFIVSAIMGFVVIIFTACSAGVGNSIVTESIEKNYNDLKKLTLIIVWISGFCSACFLNLMQPFMELWMGKDLMQGGGLVVCFVGYFYICEVNNLLNMYKDAAGLWHEDRFRPLVTAMVNLGSNIILVNYWGLYGIALSTVFSIALVGMPWLLHNLFSVLFSRELLIPYLKKLFVYTLGVGLVSIMCTLICSMISFGLWWTLIIRLLVCVIFVNSMFYFIYRKDEEFKQSIILLDKITKGKLHLSKLA